MRPGESMHAEWRVQHAQHTHVCMHGRVARSSHFIDCPCTRPTPLPRVQDKLRGCQTRPFIRDEGLRRAALQLGTNAVNQFDSFHFVLPPGMISTCGCVWQ